MPQVHDPILQRLGNVLHVHIDDITHEPLPRHFVDLIRRLSEQEGNQSQQKRLVADLSESPDREA